MEIENKEEEIEEKGKESLSRRLRNATPEELPDLLREYHSEMITSPHPFADYMRNKCKEKGILQQNVFLAADLSENYGYKLIAEEKRTRQRDVILRLCLAAHFSEWETGKALILYGMAPLYPCFPRDAVLVAAINNGVYDLQEINRLLERFSQTPLVKDYE
ncbi:MAG: hypothetical protein IKQ69_04895 [Oscillospiraceae bacterium]|nr:hypothetical protein [Oscillospiraceae bacterium]